MPADFSLHCSPLAPTWLFTLLALALFTASTVGTAALVRAGVTARWVATLALLRLGAWALFVLILLQPALAWSSHRTPRSELLVLLDMSRSMAQPGVHGTRLDDVRTPLTQGKLADALAERFRPNWFAFDQQVYRVEAHDLAGLTPTDRTARLAYALQTAHALLQAGEQPPRRVLLAGAGHDLGLEDCAALARQLGVKIDVLAPATQAKTPRPAVEVADVQAARRVLLGSETHLRVTLRAEPAAQERKLTLRLRENEREVQALPIVFKAGQGEQVHVLAHRPTTLGTKTYAVDVEQTPGSTKRVTVEVLDQKYEALVLEDTWRWEYRFLHRLLEDDPSFRFTALLPRGKNAFVQFASPDRRVKLIGFPQSAAELEGFDLFFLGDVQPARWPRELPAALARLVADEGKSLVVLAGTQLGNLMDVPALHALLPVELTRESGTPLSGASAVRPRPEAAASPFFFQLSAGAGELPPLDHIYPVLRKRPGATVLLEAPRHRNDYGPLIVMAEHTVGRGRVLFVGTDTLWKWQTLATGDGPTPYAIFWQQALRALTPQRSNLGPVQLWITPARSRVPADQSLDIAVEVQSAQPVLAGQLQAAWTGPTGARTRLVLNADPGNPARFRTTLTPRTPGPSHIHVTLASEGKTAAAGHAEVMVAETDAEPDEVNGPGLRRLVAATGGSWLDPANPATWPRADEDTADTVSGLRTFDLWSSFTLLLLLLALLGADWTVRVVKGLV